MKCLLHFSTNVLVKSTSRLSYKVVTSSLVGAFHQNLLQSLPQNKWMCSRLQFSGTALSVCLSFAGFSLPALFNNAYAGPQGGVVTGGSGTISKDDLMTIINQTSQNMVIDWDSYNIDANEIVRYIQPNGQSISLNRILGVNGSTIAGKIQSNGQVILINPNGLVFTESAVINVGGIIASGLNMNTSDFMNGDYIFNEVVGTEGKVINRGLISASLGGNKVGGNVALIGKQVENSGLISANLGSVTLAAGKQAVMTFETGGLLGVRVSKEILQNELGLDAAVINSGEINAQGGRVLLTASTSQDIFSQAVNGLDQASSAVVHADGSFTLGGGADVINSGSIDVSSGDYSQTAGQIVLIGENVTSSGDLLANSTNSGDTGSIELHANDTTLLTGNGLISASGSITLTADADNDGVGDFVMENSKNKITIQGGDVTISGANVTAGIIESNGGTVNVTATHGQLKVKCVTSQGGAVNLEASNLAGKGTTNTDITVGDINTTGGDNTAGGAITINSTNGGITAVNLTAHGGIATFDSPGSNAGEITLTAKNDIWVKGAISAQGSDGFDEDRIAPSGQKGGRGNNITITSTAGNIQIDQAVSSQGGDGHVETGIGAADDYAAGGHAGNITLSAVAGIVEVNGTLDSSGGNAAGTFANVNRVGGNAGSISVTGIEIHLSGNVSAKGGSDVDAANYGLGNDITLNGATVIKGDLSIDATGSKGGDVTINGFLDSDSIGSHNVALLGNKVELKGAVGSINALSTLSIDVTKQAIVNNINTTGDVNISASGDSINTDSTIVINGELKNNSGVIELTIDSAVDGTVNINHTGAFSSGLIVTGQGAGEHTLTAADRDNAWDVNAGKSTLNTNISFTGIENIIGGALNDTFSVDTLNSIGKIDGGIGGTDSVTFEKAGQAVVLGGNIDNIDIINATGKGNSITGWSSVTHSNIWTIANSGNQIEQKQAGKDSQTLQTVTFTNFDSLTGGSGVDTFNVSDVSTITGVIDGGGGLDTLDISALTTDQIVELGNNETANLNVNNIETITANSAMVNTLIGDDIENSWLTTGINSGSLNGLTFENFANFVGGNKVDTFTITHTLGSIDAGQGSDIINITNLDLVNSIEGGDNALKTDIDTLNITGGTQTVNLDKFTGIEKLAATGGGTYTLQANNDTNIWSTTGVNSGLLNDLTFENFANLMGGTGKDIFTITHALDSIDAGEGSDIINITNMDLVNSIEGGDNAINTDIDTLNITGGTQTVNLDKFTGIEKLAGTGGGTYTLQANNDTNIWSTTGVNSGLLNDLTFENFTNLMGGTGKDIFTITHAIGHIDAGEGSDIINITNLDLVNSIEGGNDALSTDIDIDTLNITGSTQTVNIDKFYGIEKLAATGGGTYTLQAEDRDNTWITTGKYNGELNGLIFENFANLSGGNKVDNFTISHVINQVIGGEGVDTFNIANMNFIEKFIDGGTGVGAPFVESDTVNITTDGQTVDLAKLKNIELLVGQGDAINTIQGANTNNNWSVTASNEGSVNGMKFKNFTDLIGGAKDDSFTITSFSDIGKIDGGDHTFKDSLTLTDDNQNVVLGSDVFNIESLTAAGGINTLQGANETNNWQITGANKGTLNEDISFTNFENLIGGNQNDSFTLASFSDIGSIDGGDQTSQDSVKLTSGSQTVLLGIDVKNIEVIEGTGNNNTLKGENIVNSWVIDGSNSGTLNNMLAFEGFKNLTGGTLADTFSIDTGGSISGLIDGNLNTVGTDSLIIKDNKAYTVEIGNTINENLNVNNIENVTAHTGKNNILIGANSQANWLISDASNTVQYGTDLIKFSNFKHLVGGDQVDTFTMSGGTLDSIKMGDGNDKFKMSDGYVKNVFGGKGDDVFTVDVDNNKKGHYGKLDGEEGIDYIVYSAAGINIQVGVDIDDFEGITSLVGDGTISARDGVTTTWNIFAQDKGKVSDSHDPDTELFFSGFNTVNGGSGQDQFILEDGIDSDTGATTYGSISGLVDGKGGKDSLIINTTNKGQVIELGSDVTDNLNIVNIETLTANSRFTNTLIADDKNNQWVIDKLRGGSIDDGSYTVNFTNIDNFTGGEADDSFTVTSIDNVTGIMDGKGHINGDSLILINDNQSIQLGTDVTNVETITAAGGNNTLYGQDTTNDWTISGKNSGDVNGIKFNKFTDLVGGSLDDNFTLASFDHITSINGGGQKLADSVTLTADNQTVIINEDIFNIESIIAKGASNTLQGADTDNIWNITSLNKGEVNGISFSNFTNLQGGALDDSFTLHSMDHISGIIKGGKHVNGDSVELTSGNQVVKLGSDIDGIERVSAFGGQNSLFAKDKENNWHLTALNSGDVNGITFTNFTDLFGGDLVDIFKVSANGALTGIINGGDGADQLIVNLSSNDRTESGALNFVGGDDGSEDVVLFQGINGEIGAFSEIYQANQLINGLQFDQLSFENNNNGATLAVNFRDVARVTDNVQTSSLTINNAGVGDKLFLGGSSFGSGSGSVDISFDSLEKGNITVQAFDNSSLELIDDITVRGDFTITANSLSQTKGTINASRLILDNVKNAGLNNAINTNIDELQVLNHSGEIYINQAGDLLLGAINNTTGLIDITALESIIRGEGGLNSTGELTLHAKTIDLMGFNNLAGNIDLTAYDITLNNDTITNLVGIKASHVSVISKGTIHATGDIDVSANGNGSAIFFAKNGDIILDGNNDIDYLNLKAANNISLANLTAGRFVAETINGNISSAGIINVSQNFDDITTTLIANNGDISLLNANNDFNKISVKANNAQIVDRNDLTVLDSQLTNNLTVNANGRLALGKIRATNSMYLNAGLGNIVSEQSDLTASQITLRATTGIGSGDYDNLISGSTDNRGAINLHTANLSAINSTSGIVNLSNEQNVTITDLRNNGDIVLSNNGDILLQVTNIEGTTTEQGAIDANYGQSIGNTVYSGSVALLTTSASSVYTSAGLGETLVPDIIAENLWVQSVASFGTFTHPIRLRVNNEFTFIGVSPFVTYSQGEPRSINSSADITVISSVTGLSGLQLVEVESLSDIDPAIFSDVRNYDVDDVSVLLPLDQRLNDDANEDVEDDDEIILSASVR